MAGRALRGDDIVKLAELIWEEARRRAGGAYPRYWKRVQEANRVLRDWFVEEVARNTRFVEKDVKSRVYFRAYGYGGFWEPECMYGGNGCCYTRLIDAARSWVKVIIWENSRNLIGRELENVVKPEFLEFVAKMIRYPLEKKGVYRRAFGEVLERLGRVAFVVGARRVTLWELNAPDVVLKSTFRWFPGRSSAERRENERRRIREVTQWLEELDKKYGLGLRIEHPSSTEVVAYKDGKRVAYFSYSESAHHVYKHQDFGGLIDLISSMVEKPPFKLSREERRFYEKLAEFEKEPKRGPRFEFWVGLLRRDLKPLVELSANLPDDDLEYLCKVLSELPSERKVLFAQLVRKWGIKTIEDESCEVLLELLPAAEEVDRLDDDLMEILKVFEKTRKFDSSLAEKITTCWSFPEFYPLVESPMRFKALEMILRYFDRVSRDLAADYIFRIPYEKLDILRSMGFDDESMFKLFADAAKEDKLFRLSLALRERTPEDVAEILEELRKRGVRVGSWKRK